MLTTGAFSTSWTPPVPVVAAAATLPRPAASVTTEMPDAVTTAAAVRQTRPRREEIRIAEAASHVQSVDGGQQQSGSSKDNVDDLSMVRTNAHA
jgi:hypothetical protein